MGRPRSFEQEEILRLAAQAFAVGGYEGTSVDDLVKALNLHRGSLYKAFGSKRGLFLAVLSQYVRTGLAAAVRTAQDQSNNGGLFEALTDSSELDLLLIAAIERGHQDAEVASLVREALDLLEDLLGGDLPIADGRSSRPAALAVARGVPAQAIRLMGAHLYQRLMASAQIPNNSADPLRKASDGTDQH